MNTESVAGRSLSWDSPLTNLRGVGKVRSRRLSEAGYDCVGDLLYHFPTRYLPVPETVSIGQLRPEMRARVTGRVVSITLVGWTRSGSTSPFGRACSITVNSLP